MKEFPLIGRKTALVTGSSGFIGFHVSKKLLSEGFRVVGVDSMSDYYDVSLKEKRQSILKEYKDFEVVNERIESSNVINSLFSSERPDVVVHLAAQAGVRYSIENPRSYIDSNIIGTFEILESARTYTPSHLLMASTSSVYGANTQMPYQERHKADNQMSFYAATKKANEVMAHSYAHLYKIPITMFRFFTVYGPWGRPDMALFKFTKSIIRGESIDVYNHGNMKRDFTYIDDLVNGICALISYPPNDRNIKIEADSISPVAPWRVVNIGNSNSIQLIDFISEIERCVGKKAIINYLPMQAGDVPETWANSELLNNITGYSPKTDISLGVMKFVEWYREYYNV